MHRTLGFPIPSGLRIVAVALASALGSSALHADVQILESPGALYPTIQGAVDAASAGDTLLIAGDVYEGFVIDGKTLTLVSLPGVVHEIQGQIVIRNLAANSRVRLDGLRVRARQNAYPVPNETGVLLQMNAGGVHFFGCDFRGGSGPDDMGADYFTVGGHGVHVTACSNVVFLDCDLTGGNGAGDHNGFVGDGGAGGRGLWSQNSAVAIYDSRCFGGKGGEAGTQGGNGGDGYHVSGLGMFASGTFFKGGDGGMASDVVVTGGGDGGAGIWVELGTAARLLNNTYAGGAGGFAISNPGDPGPGLFFEGGQLDEVPGTRRSLTVERSLVADGDPFNLHVAGVPGDRVFLAIGRESLFDFSADPHGVRLVRFPNYLEWGAGILLDASGEADFQLETFDLPAGNWRSFTAQALVLPAGGGDAIGGAVFLTSIDESLAPDCNGNGI
ncbi:MAG: hypothetical protein ACI9F9_002857, partial [Candidatus Paceibacteria bacterium]